MVNQLPVLREIITTIFSHQSFQPIISDLPEEDQDDFANMARGIAAIYHGDFDFGITELQELKYTSSLSDISEVLLLINVYLAEGQRRKGNTTEAMILVEAICTVDELLDRDEYAWVDLEVFKIYGRLLLFDGQYSTAVSLLKKGIEVAEDLQEKGFLAILQNILGYVLRMQGKSMDALRYHQLALPVLEELKYLQHLANCSENIGIVVYSMQRIVEAEQYFEESLQLRLQLQDPFYLAWTLYNLCRIYLDTNREKFHFYYLQLQELEQHSSTRVITDRRSLITALELQRSQRYQLKIDAMKLFTEIADRTSLVELEHASRLAKIELLLEEFELLGDETILAECRDQITTLTEKARKQQAADILINLYILSSRIDLIEHDVESAENNLVRAKELAHTSGISGKDQFLHEFEQFLKRFDETTTFRKMLDQSDNPFGLRTIANQIAKFGGLAFNHLELDPIAFLISTDYGSLLYSLNLGDLDMNENLMANFLSAIISFSSELIAEEPEQEISMDEINFQGHSILLCKIKNLVFAYIYSGVSLLTYDKVLETVNLLIKQPFLAEKFDMPLVLEGLNSLQQGIIAKIIEQELLQ